MKICKVLWSTNRLEYLIPTLKSQRDMLDFSDCEVEGIFIDDMPKKRHDGTMYELARLFGYQEVILRPKNMGLPYMWNSTFDMLKERDYDYVYLSEDDVVINEPIKITDVIDVLNSDPTYSQISLARQKWYHHEPETGPLDTDIIINQYRIEYLEHNFTSLASLFRREIVNLPHLENTNTQNLNEAVVGQSTKSMGMKNYKLKNSKGANLVTHIGEYTVGKKIELGDPGYERFSMYDPEVKYCSKMGFVWNQ
jgi:hypothetical protein